MSKVVSTALFDITQHPSIPPAQRSPAYDIIKAFQLSALELGEIFDTWLKHESIAGSAFTLRHATCSWMVDHWDKVQSWIPRDYPRVTQKAKDTLDDPLGLTSVVLAWIAALAVIMTIVCIYLQRKRPVIRHAQIGFLWIILAGLFLVAAGNLISVAPPSNLTCATSTWLINLGYTLEVVPLIVKVAAIQRMVHAAKKARRIVVDMNHLYAAVAAISSLVVIFLLLWSILDLPGKDAIYTLSSDKTRNGETIVWVGEFCHSESNVWRYCAAVWHSLLLMAASVLAFTTRKIKTDFNENQSLSLMIYSHAIFVLLRILTYSLESGESGETDAVFYRSLIFSCDTLSTVGIYFVSKFLAKDDHSDIVDLRSSQLSQRTPSSRIGTSNAARRVYKRETAPIPSIMEVQNESGNDSGEDANAGGSSNSDPPTTPYKWTAALETPRDAESRIVLKSAGDSRDDEDDKGLEDRLTNFLSSQAMAGLRCRHCGKFASDERDRSNDHC